jgi:cell wall-associated NlpC family hydrolase
MDRAKKTSTGELLTSRPSRWGGRNRAVAAAVVVVAFSTGATSLATIAPPRAGADQLSDAKAQAAAITAQIQATDARLQSLTDQYSAADYRLSQLTGQISQTQHQLAQDQAVVAKNRSQLRKQAILDYTSSGTTSQAADLFTTDRNSAGIRQEYSALAAGNVTTLISKLRTAEAQLTGEQNALHDQQIQAATARDTIAGAKNQASTLVAQEQATKSGVDATILKLVAQQQAAAAAAANAAATAAFNAKLAASQSAQKAANRPTSPPQSSSGGAPVATTPSPVATVPPPPLAGGVAGAIQAAEGEVGVPYLWGGASPSAGFDCSGLIMWAYAQVGISLPHYSGAQYSATVHIPLSDIQPGDLIFEGPQGSEHEAMYVGGGQMIEAPHTGAFVRIVGVRTDSSTVIGRVQ